MMNNRPSKKKIEITEHAKKRLQERAPHIQTKQYREWVYNARYKGKTLEETDDFVKKWICGRLRTNKTQLRFFDKYVFVFKGNSKHVRTLITIYPIPEKIQKYINNN